MITKMIKEMINGSGYSVSISARKPSGITML